MAPEFSPCFETGGRARSAALARCGEFLLLVRPGLAPCPGALQALAEAAGREPRTAAFAGRVLPCGPRWDCDPVTLSAGVMTFDAVLLRAAALRAAGGFDAALSGAAADADCCWRLRAAGWALRYVPEARFAPAEEKADDAKDADGGGNADGKPALADYAAGLKSAFLLRAEYGAFGRGLNGYLSALRAPVHYAGVRRALAGALPGAFFAALGRALAPAPKAARRLCCLDDGWGPDRGACALAPLPRTPLVSVVVRTCGRPDTLRETLRSLRHQTYKNVEVVVAEDGPETARTLLETEFGDLRLCYFCTGQKVGRGRAGNLGIEHAHGEYLCFLDDDDCAYPDFVELPLSRLLACPGAELAFSSSMALEADVLSRSPYRIDIKRAYPVIFDHITLMDLCVRCCVPVSAALFARGLYERCGGMREDVGGDEDWAMWLKFLRCARLCAPSGPQVPRAVSACLYPADRAEARQREIRYAVYDRQVRNDPALEYDCTPAELAFWHDTVRADAAHLRGVGCSEAFLARLAQAEKAGAEPAEGGGRFSARQLSALYWRWMAQELPGAEGAKA